MELIRIDDPADPAHRRLSVASASATSSGATGRFIAEGKVVLNVLFAAGRFEPESVLVLENRLAGPRRHAAPGAAVDAGLCRAAAP